MSFEIKNNDDGNDWETSISDNFFVSITITIVRVVQTEKYVVQNFMFSVSENGMLDGIHMKDRELYYSLLRVTNALNYTYIIRSNGVTIEEDPLLPGKVFDGYITGFDLNILPSQRKVTANWDGFGLPASASFQVDVEGRFSLKSIIVMNWIVVLGKAD